MTRPRPARVVAELPIQHAELLAVVHGLALRVAVARRDSGYSAQLEALERERGVAEIVATSHGIPVVWVAQARETGATEQEWRPDTILRQAPHQANLRRSARRVAADTVRLADMAATAAVREHLLTQAGYPGQPDPVATEQLHRNMHALRTRITATAEAITMKPGQLRRSTTITDTDLAHRVRNLLEQRPDDIEVRWRDFTTPQIAASVRSSLASLRRHTDTTTTLSRPGAADPVDLISRARAAMNIAVEASGASPGAAIDRAVASALPDRAVPQHNPETTSEVAQAEEELFVTRPPGPTLDPGL
ncbi:hypothetical protein [Nocardia asteroides]